MLEGESRLIKNPALLFTLRQTYNLQTKHHQEAVSSLPSNHQGMERDESTNFLRLHSRLLGLILSPPVDQNTPVCKAWQTKKDCIFGPCILSPYTRQYFTIHVRQPWHFCRSSSQIQTLIQVCCLQQPSALLFVGVLKRMSILMPH
jgi:hypothetical protein